MKIKDKRHIKNKRTWYDISVDKVIFIRPVFQPSCQYYKRNQIK